MGKMVYVGVVVEMKWLDDGIMYVIWIMLNGEEIEKYKQYFVVVFDMFIFGRLFLIICDVVEKEYFMLEFLWDLFVWKFV